MLNAPNFALLFEQLFHSKNGSEPNGVPWWKDLDGEVKQGRLPSGRYLEQTLGKAMGSEYRTLPRQQFFFSTHKQSCMDGRVGGIGIEEKVINLDFAGIRDGAICRSLVWVLGNPMGLTEPLGALGLCVLKKKSGPMSAELAIAVFPIIEAVRRFGVEIVFVNAIGKRWPEEPSGTEPPPEWLAEPTPFLSKLLEFDEEDVVVAENLQPMSVTEHLFGDRGRHWAAVPGQDRIAYAEWNNHWQMLDIGLLLRARGFRAVKVKYMGPPVRAAGHGIEACVQRKMRETFGVVLDWGIAT